VVFGITKIGCVVVLRAELLVVADQVGYVKRLRVFVFEGYRSTEVKLSAWLCGLYLDAVM
jgi:hypothetical protein